MRPYWLALPHSVVSVSAPARGELAWVTPSFELIAGILPNDAAGDRVGGRTTQGRDDAQAGLGSGMCFIDEPMITIYGEFGMRHEDCLYITDAGPKFFTPLSRSIEHPV